MKIYNLIVNKKRIFLESLKEAIKKFKNINKYHLIGLFGSFLEKKKKKLGDIDLISTSNNKIHKDFINHLINIIENKGVRVYYFDTIKKRDLEKIKEPKSIAIHDLHYKNLEDLNKEWPTVLDSIKKDIVIFYGNKKLLNKAKVPKITEDSIINPLEEWLKSIKTKDELENFKSHCKKIIPIMIKRYPKIKTSKLKRYLDKVKNIKFFR